eukprot:367_1
MALTKVIQFQHLITQLTDEEFTTFLSTILDSHKAIIITGLFNHLVQTDHINQTDAFNTSLSDIIQSRKEKPKATSTRNMALYQLESLELRKQLGEEVTKESGVFTLENGSLLSKRKIGTEMKRLCKVVGLNGSLFTPHSLRKGGATDYIAWGITPEIVEVLESLELRKQLGE